MANTFTTEYFENATLYTEKHAVEWLPEHDERPAMHIGFNINDPFFKPLGAEITSILETNKDIAFSFHVFVDSYSPENKDNLENLNKKIRIFSEFSNAVDRMIAGEYIDTEYSCSFQ